MLLHGKKKAVFTAQKLGSPFQFTILLPPFYMPGICLEESRSIAPEEKKAAFTIKNKTASSFSLYILYIVHLDYNDISFYIKSIVISRLSLHQKGANGFYAKFSYQKVKKTI